MITEKEKKITCIEEYLSYGWKLVPIKPKSKRPILNEWTTNYISNEKDFEKYLDDNIDTNIGVICGKPSGIVVIDVDVEKDKEGNLTGYDGLTSIRQKEAELRSKLPDTIISQTQGGGLQMWFKYPKNVDKILSTVGKLRCVDIRADKSQVVVYPSIGEKGKYYWLNSPKDTKLAELPEEWVKFLTQETSSSPNIIKLAVMDNFQLPVKIPVSTRNDTLFKYCCSMLSKGMSVDDLAKNLVRVNSENCVDPLDNKELETILNSAIKTNSKNTSKKEEIANNTAKTESDISNEEDNNAYYPWLLVNDENGKITISEPLFAEWYMKKNKLYFIHDRFYDEFGEVSDGKIKNSIQTLISSYCQTKLDTKVNNLLNALKNLSYYDPPLPMPDVINFKNVSIKVEKDKITQIEKPFTFNRLEVMYKQCEVNEEWIKYINELLYPEDVITLQEYLGYCLIPTTQGQKALFVIGQGGEGKSGISYVMQKLLNSSCIVGEFHEIENDPFLLSNLENKLLFIDDDLQLNALNNTGRFKKFVTMNGKFTVNKKNVQQYHINPYTRFICLGNGVIKAKNDKTEGFYSRLIVIKVKPLMRRGTSVDDKQLYEKICTNLSGIANWCIEGLQRLLKNNFNFTISDQSRSIIDDLKEDSLNAIPFINDTNYVEITKNKNDSLSNKELIDLYHLWCIDNEMSPMGEKSFVSYLKDTASYNGIEYSRTIKNGDKYVRGFVGIKNNRKRKGAIA